MVTKYIFFLLILGLCTEVYADWTIQKNEKYIFQKTIDEVRPILLNDNLEDIVIDSNVIFLEDKNHHEDILSLLNSKDYIERDTAGKSPNFGYSESKYWGYFRISEESSISKDFYLTFNYPLLDFIYVHCYNGINSVVQFQAGDHIPLERWNQKFRKPSFKIPKETKECWIEVISDTTYQVSFEINTENNFNELRSRDILIQSLYYGGLITILTYNFFLFISTRSFLYILYCLFLLSFALFQLSISGIGFMYIWPETVFRWIDRALHIFLYITGISSYLFSFSILEVKSKPRVWKVSIIILCAISPYIFFVYFISIKFASIWIISLGVIWTTYIAGLSIYMSLYGIKVAKYFLFAWSFILFGSLINSLLTLNIIPRNFFTVNAHQIGSVLEFTLLSIVLGYKVNLKQKEISENLRLSNQELKLTKERATKAYHELEASQKQLVQSDKMITLGTMLAGVAHEINTPLGAIKANSENILESLRGLILKLNPSLSHLTLDELQTSLKILELSKESTTPFSSREARALRKKVISLLEERNLSNVDLLADFIVELNLVEALERNEEILFSPGLEKVLSLASDLHGIRKKSTVIQTSAERVSKIVKSLKSFMHFDQNEKKVLADLTEGMETVLIILHNKIKMGIEVTKKYGEDVPQILCFPDELNQVWTNLIHNAIQAMDEKGSLQIDIEKVPNPEGNPDIDKRNPEYKGDYISVSIQDSGFGIAPEIRQKIFQAFFTTKAAGEGSGLGLHIIGKILEKHEGALYLESEPGRTRFSVLLPI
jgi:two-component system NtrC family sensor kinase